MTDYLEILRHNCGFDDPAAWVEIARQRGFQKVDAVALTTCPDCGDPRRTVVGQYVYYSQLVRLRRCARCDLVYADVRLDPSVLQKHFEKAYKDEEYFAHGCVDIFKRIAAIVIARRGRNVSVLDIGGAKGHLARLLADEGLDVTVNDISADACRYARERFGLPIIRSSIEQLRDLNDRYDVVLAVDALYYAPHIREAWDSIAHVLKRDGLLVLRLPNQLWQARLFRWLTNTFRDPEAQTRMRAFNPEHMYYFTNRYLRARLAVIGLTRFNSLCSPMRRGLRGGDTLHSVLYRAGRVCEWLSQGQVAITPSKLVVAER